MPPVEGLIEFTKQLLKSSDVVKPQPRMHP
jgi:hypothetical protein